MTDPDEQAKWTTLDRDLARMSRLESAGMYVARPLVGMGVSLIFIGLAALTASILIGSQPDRLIVVVAAAFGGYMALNIGANDVANNVGPRRGARAPCRWSVRS